jgi:hypothetical protein
MIHEFDENTNELSLKRAVDFYINEMIPKLKEIQTLKYDVTMVEYDDNTNLYTLIQLPNSLENSEFFMESDDSVIAFVKGVKKASKSKTMKKEIDVDVDIDVKRTKRKTRKIKPIDNLILEEEVEEQQINNENENEIVLQSKFKDDSVEYAPQSPAAAAPASISQAPASIISPAPASSSISQTINNQSINTPETVSPIIPLSDE